jgi:hypothetical protein
MYLLVSPQHQTGKTIDVECLGSPDDIFKI